MIKITFFLLGLVFFSCNQSVDKQVQINNTKSIIDSQREVNLLVRDKLKNADSIVLISHQGNIFDSIKGEVLPEMLIKGRINKSIITEQIKISNKAINVLADIIALPTNYDSIALYKCFDPHHTIFIYNNKKISYIDMCFECWGLRTSEDLKEIRGYELYKWHRIENFFGSLGFRYAMR